MDDRRTDAAGWDGDGGLFGPGSVTWRVHAEPILWLAGYRALLLQALHPRALAGVLQNSKFRDDPWGRLIRTGRFYGEVVFGDTPTATRAGRRVRAIHARMGGIDPDTDELFRVDDADLLLWIHVTATESFCSIAQRAGLSLTDAEVDRYYHEQREVAVLVGLDRDQVPADAAGIEEYYRSVRPALRATADARATARFLTLPSFPWGLGWTPVRPLWIGVSAFAFSLLPPWARRLYGLPGLPTTDLAATLGSRTVRSLIRVTLPSRALQGPLYRAAMDRAALASTLD
ncbi:MAG TPA: oxygenase MpaB family protein [Micromonosporaceae bacterium]